MKKQAGQSVWSSRWPHIRPVTVVISAPQPAPPPVVANPAPETKPSRWSRFWAVTKSVGPAVVSLTALVISLYTYKDQSSANAAARRADAAVETSDAAIAVAAKQQYARPVSAWLTYPSLGEVHPGEKMRVDIAVQNLGRGPITETQVTAGFPGVNAADTRQHFQNYFQFGTIPPCTVAEMHVVLNYGDWVMAAEQHPYGLLYTFLVKDISFYDVNGIGWQHTYDGDLTNISRPYMNFASASAVASVRIVPATGGCG